MEMHNALMLQTFKLVLEMLDGSDPNQSMFFL